MDLIVEGRGAFVGKHQGRLRVTREGKTLTEAPLVILRAILHHEIAAKLHHPITAKVHRLADCLSRDTGKQEEQRAFL